MFGNGVDRMDGEADEVDISKDLEDAPADSKKPVV